MGLVEPTVKAVADLRGLHLYHTGRSNCSARVRLLILEKRLPWVSHHVDLYTKENVSAAYFAINPKGVVPTLVHDGRVIVESNDILLYLEEAFPEPSFTPESSTDRETMKVWLQRSADIHIPGIKTFAYAKINARLVEKTPEETALYRSLQKDPALLAFHAKHDPGKSFSEEDVNSATALLRAALSEMESNIARTGWIVGARYSLADISWAPSYGTLYRAGFSFDDFPNIIGWHGRIMEREAAKRAVADWAREPRMGVAEMAAGA
jgi:glutathione S-transferase